MVILGLHVSSRVSGECCTYVMGGGGGGGEVEV